LALNEDHMSFASGTADTNFYIDYLDVLSATKLQLPNQKSIDNPDKYIRDNYKYNIMIQIELSTVNGLSCIQTEGHEQSYEGALIDDDK